LPRRPALASVDHPRAYNLLHRHGWRKLVPRPFHPKRDLAAQNAFEKNGFPDAVRRARRAAVDRRDYDDREPRRRRYDPVHGFRHVASTVKAIINMQNELCDGERANLLSCRATSERGRLLTAQQVFRFLRMQQAPLRRGRRDGI